MSLKIGPYHIHQIDAGKLYLDGGAMFGIIPRPLWERKIAPDSRGRIPLAMRCLLIESSDRLILVDNGLGDKYDDRFADIYGVDQESSDLHSSLRAVGFDASDITDVLLTHLHFDHCGGTTRRDSTGELQLVFPHARHHVQQSHWEWAHTSPREQASFLQENLQPMVDQTDLILYDGPGEFLPGIELITVDGHTRGQQLIHIHDGERHVLYAADLFPTSAHIPLLWIMAYDVAPLDTLAEKENLLPRVVTEKWHVIFEHDEKVAIAQVEATDKGHRVIGDMPVLPSAL